MFRVRQEGWDGVGLKEVERMTRGLCAANWRTRKEGRREVGELWSNLSRRRGSRRGRSSSDTSGRSVTLKEIKKMESEMKALLEMHPREVKFS